MNLRSFLRYSWHFDALSGENMIHPSVEAASQYGGLVYDETGRGTYADEQFTKTHLARLAHEIELQEIPMVSDSFRSWVGHSFQVAGTGRPRHCVGLGSAH